jgi:adenine/guanine phosphoribosyltransferase-like PRPP-binding protein
MCGGVGILYSMNHNRDYIQEAFEMIPIQIVSGKKYCINTLTDHTPITQPEFLKQIIHEATELVNFEEADFIVGEEDRGGYVCALLSLPWNKPFTLTKWNPSGFEGELHVDFKNAYTDGKLYLNGISPEFKKAIIVEDLIDTGGTIVAMVALLKSAGIEVIDIFAVAEKADYGGLERVERDTGITPKVLVKFSSEGDLSKVMWRFESAQK